MIKRRWPYWAKGALIFGVIFLPLFWVNEANQFGFLPLMPIWLILGFWFTLPVSTFFLGASTATVFTDTERIVGICIVVVAEIVIGALVGWVFGKIRPPKKT